MALIWELNPLQITYQMHCECSLGEKGATGSDWGTSPHAALPEEPSHSGTDNLASCLAASHPQTAPGSGTLQPDMCPAERKILSLHSEYVTSDFAHCATFKHQELYVCSIMLIFISHYTVLATWPNALLEPYCMPCRKNYWYTKY